MALSLPIRVRKAGWAIAGVRPVAVVLRVLRSPLWIFLVFAGVLWTWHLPGPYEAAARSNLVHAAEHAMFLGVSMAFWGAAMRTGPRRRTAHVPSMMLVLGTMLQSTWLAAILTFGNLAYPSYARRAALLGIDPRLDEQLAGSLMWIPMTITYFVVFGVLFARWFRELDARHARSPAAVGRP
jgi:putative membrane protein